jgi:uncharacterized protein YkwD
MSHDPGALRVDGMRLLLVITAAALIALPSAANAGKILNAELLVRQCANSERARAGLPPLARAPALDAAARSLARDMAARRFFDHTDPDGNGPQERVDAIESGWLVGENIAAGYRTVRSACRGWMKSSGHRENILNPDYEAIGGGYALGPRGPFFVQDFAFRAGDESGIEPEFGPDALRSL